MRSRRMSSLIHHTASGVRPPAPTHANGGPLSERMAAGNPNSWNAESKMRCTSRPSGSSTPSQRIRDREAARSQPARPAAPLRLVSPRVQRRACARSSRSDATARALRGVTAPLPETPPTLRVRSMGSAAARRREGVHEVREAEDLPERSSCARGRGAWLPRGRLGRELRTVLARRPEASR